VAVGSVPQAVELTLPTVDDSTKADDDERSHGAAP
jgi:hypothetical protein